MNPTAPATSSATSSAGRRPATLTARVVAVVVALVALTALAIATATTLAMRANLDQQLDRDVSRALDREIGGPPGMRGPGGFEPGGSEPGEDRVGEVGTVSAAIPDTGTGTAQGRVLAEQEGESWVAWEALTTEQLDALGGVDPADGPQTVDVPGLGDYRVDARELDGGTVVVGLPMTGIEETISDLVRLELLATLVGIVLAAVVATFVVRRQLAPLREVAATAHRVAELPLAEGAIDLRERVPERLTDQSTEVGQVGAALNTLLEHVEESLTARHRSEQQVRQFVADASHELRTPLATIAGYTELARRRPDATGTALDKVEAETRRMTALVEDLLLLARLDAGRTLAREPVDLILLLAEAVNDARVVDAEHTWRLVRPDDGEVEVLGDPARLHQVVTNLLTNARKHTPPGTTVTVSVRPDGFEVHDDGPGFDPDLAGQAFERFVRGDLARSREGGAGLGLALVSAIVDAHGGRVDLTSRAGDTTISVRLPT